MIKITKNQRLKTAFKSQVLIVRCQVFRKGFTLVEMILYVAIASVFLTVMIGFFWQIRQGEIRNRVRRELNENTAQVMQVFASAVRNAESLDGGSQFGVNPSVVVLGYAGGDKVFDTYTKTVTVGGLPAVIRKLRLSEGGDSYDLTSDHADVNLFRVDDFTQGGQPPVLRISLALSSVNPGQTFGYEDEAPSAVTVNVRNAP